jgi:hypothetical protein
MRQALPQPSLMHPRSLGPCERLLAKLSIVVVFVFLGWPVAAFLLFGARVALLTLMLPSLCALIGYSVASRWAYVRDAREVIAADYECCGHCRYVLSGRPSTGVCPECGHEYSIPESQRHWRRYCASAVEGYERPG